MPMLSRTEVGMVIAIWGQAWIRGADGMFRALKLGETLHKGTVVLTAQDAIVQIAAEGTGDDLDPSSQRPTRRSQPPMPIVRSRASTRAMPMPRRPPA